MQLATNKFKSLVTEQGVEIEGIWYGSSKLLPFVGEHVIACLSLIDKSQVFIFTAKPGSSACGSYVCCAKPVTEIHPQPSKRKSYLAVAQVLHLQLPETVISLRAVIDSVYQRHELGATHEEAELIVAQMIEELLFTDTKVLASKLAVIRGQGNE